MKIRDTLERDPDASALANNGQAIVGATKDEENSLRILRAELETFVCDGEYGRAMSRMLGDYLHRLGTGRQQAAWVSGYFGSGKSHLLKMFGHLWRNTQFKDGTFARTLVRDLPDDVADLLRELDTAARRLDQQRLLLAGSLLGAGSDFVRLEILALAYEARGLPRQHQLAGFELWLHGQGKLFEVTQAIEAQGRNFQDEVSNLEVSPVLAAAVHAALPGIAASADGVLEQLSRKFPQPAADLSTPEFLKAFRAALAYGGTHGPDDLPLTVLVLDEAQQYVGDNPARGAVLAEAVEALYDKLDGRVLTVASGQSALKGTPNLTKLKDRFVVGVQLSDADVKAVTRQVLLTKKPSAAAQVEAVLEQNAGEVSSHLADTRLGPRPADAADRVVDYPLLPVRRRFWEACFGHIDNAGNNSQLRSQLQILHGCLQRIGDEELGAVIPADALYDATSVLMQNTGVLSQKLALTIGEQEKTGPDGPLRKSLAATVFLISCLPASGAGDLGVRADEATLAGLTNPRIDGAPAAFRQRCRGLLDAMVADAVLMRVGDSFRLQTEEGKAWEDDFAQRLGGLQQNPQDLGRRRDELLRARLDGLLSGFRFAQGQSKTPRRFALQEAGADAPPSDRDLDLVLTDGWTQTRKSVEAEAREAGQDSPRLWLFVPKEGTDGSALSAAVAEADAAEQTLRQRSGAHEDDDQREARAAMKTRHEHAAARRDRLLAEAVDRAQLLLGGGSEAPGMNVVARLEAAAATAAGRKFPRFGEAEAPAAAWSAAAKKLAQGGPPDKVLEGVGHSGDTASFPVVRAIVEKLHGPTTGSELRKRLTAAPFGWPQEAVDAGLLAGTAAHLLKATRGGVVRGVKDLPANQIAGTEFRTESVQLKTGELIAVRSLFKKLGLSVASGQEDEKAPAFLNALEELARRAGGPPPQPAPPESELLADLRAAVGNERLRLLAAEKAQLEGLIADWTRRADLQKKRMTAWDRLNALSRHAAGTPEAEAAAEQIDAIRAARSLLAPADPTPSLTATLAAALRAKLAAATEAHAEAHAREAAALEADAGWQGLDEAKRQDLRQKYRLAPPAAPAVGDDAALVRALDASSLEQRATETDSLPTRFGNARAAAAAELAPRARPVAVTRATLTTEDDLTAWLKSQEDTLRAALKDGPVVLT